MQRIGKELTALFSHLKAVGLTLDIYVTGKLLSGIENSQTHKIRATYSGVPGNDRFFIFSQVIVMLSLVENYCSGKKICLSSSIRTPGWKHLESFHKYIWMPEPHPEKF